MIVEVGEKRFVAFYFPFFRTARGSDFDEWGIRLADGGISDITMIVFDTKTPIPELYENARWLINEYVLEDDNSLTTRAIQLKRQLMEIFHEQRD
jgi:hypothetical protein